MVAYVTSSLPRLVGGPIANEEMEGGGGGGGGVGNLRKGSF